MGMQTVELEVSQEISSGQDVTDTYVPPNNAEVFFDHFNGQAAFTPDSDVLVIWDFEGPGEEILWSTRGADQSVINKFRTGDGSKKVAVCCSNGEASAIKMSGKLTLRVKT